MKTIRQMVRASLLLLVFGLAGASQNPMADIRDWLPMTVGDRWTYQEEVHEVNKHRPYVQQWEWQEETVAVQSIPEGTLIRRTIRFVNKTVAPAWFHAPTESNILVRNGCAYFLDESPSYRHVHPFDASTGRLVDEFRRQLAAGKAPPDVCFPVQAGKIWGDLTKVGDYWKVDGLGRKQPGDPVALGTKPWRLKGHLTSGDDAVVWFERGTGIVAMRTFHNGTYHEERIRLERFEPAASAR